MSRSDWGKQPKAGLIGALLTGVVGVVLYWSMFYDMGYQSGYNERKAQIEAEHYASETANQIERECSAESSSPARECIAKIVKSERESQRDESDLAAQWQAANWAKWAVIIAGAQLIATAAGLYYVKGTLDATLKAVEDTSIATEAMQEANEISRLSHRAWVLFDTLVLDSRSESGEIIFDLCLQLKNFGASPAMNVRIEIGSRTTELPCDHVPHSLDSRRPSSGDRGVMAPGGLAQSDSILLSEAQALQQWKSIICRVSYIDFATKVDRSTEFRICVPPIEHINDRYVARLRVMGEVTAT